MFSFPYWYCYCCTVVLLPHVAQPFFRRSPVLEEQLPGVPPVGTVDNIVGLLALEVGLDGALGRLAHKLRLVLRQKDAWHLGWEFYKARALDNWGQGWVSGKNQGLLVGEEGGGGHHSHSSFHETVWALCMRGDVPHVGVYLPGAPARGRVNRQGLLCRGGYQGLGVT